MNLFHLTAPFRALWKAQQGSTMIIVGVAMLIMMSATGAAIDMGRAQMVQSRLSSSLDAAGLAAASSAESGDITAIMTRYFYVNYSMGYMGTTIKLLDIKVSSDKQILTLDAIADMPTTFLKVIGIKIITLKAHSQVTRTNQGMELVLAMDNTGSMKDSAGGSTSKIAAAQAAATTLINILYGNNNTVPNLWVGIVPFSQTVNIGNSHVDWVDFSNTTRVDNTAAIDWGTGTGSGWYGCVMARANTTANQATPQWDITDDTPSVKMFTPYYYGCHWSNNNNWYGTDSSKNNCCVPGGGVNTSTCAQSSSGGSTSGGSSSGGSTTSSSSNSGSGSSSNSGSGSGSGNSSSSGSSGGQIGLLTPFEPAPLYSQLPPHDLKNAATTWYDEVFGIRDAEAQVQTFHYFSGSSSGYKSPLNTTQRGPNLFCPQPITPLTSSKNTILHDLGTMVPAGNTVINLGLAWSWRLRSPKWRGLWGGEMNSHNLPLDYNTKHMSKVVILLTDGDNNVTAGGNANNWYAYGIPFWQDFLIPKPNYSCGVNGSNCTAGINELNKRTLKVCTDMKTSGIIIYTVALGASINATSKQLLSDCATNPAFAFISPTTNDLQNVFKKIADSLANLRISL